MPTSPESAIKSLARLPSNCTCPNCGTYSKYGFNTICIKYLTFICNACKSSHQAISHRCKSLTMSTWDHGEVLQLKIHGNDYARKVWLATAPPPGVGGRPKEGDDINVFKRFVMDVYENKRYYREPAADASAEEVPPKPSTDDFTPKFPKQIIEPIAPISASAPTVDLLDFGVFDCVSQTPSVVAPVTSTLIELTTVSKPKEATMDPFDPFHCDPIVTGNSSASNSSANVSFNHTSGSFMNHAINTSAPSERQVMFDPFGNTGTTQQPPAVTKLPVMNGGSSDMMNQSGMGIINSKRNDANNHPFGYPNQITANIMNGSMMPSNGIGPNNNLLMNNGSFMGNNQMFYGMQNNGGGHYSGQEAVNRNVMQPTNYPISNNFSSKTAYDEHNKKPDPFAGLGF